MLFRLDCYAAAMICLATGLAIGLLVLLVSSKGDDHLPIVLLSQGCFIVITLLSVLVWLVQY